MSTSDDPIERPSLGEVEVRSGEDIYLDEEDLELQRGRVEEILARESFIPKIRMGWLIPRFIRRRIPDLPPDVQYRLDLVTTIGRYVLLVLLFTFAVAAGGKILLGLTITEPSNGREVLERIDDPDDVTWVVETVRLRRVDGVLRRTDTLRAMAANFEKNRFQFRVEGISKGFQAVGDGKIAVFNDGGQPRQLTPYPTKDAMRPLLASDVRERAGRIISKDYTAFSQQAWLLEWKPSRQDLLRLLSVDLLRLSGPDIEALRADRFLLRRASAVVLRKERRLYQLYVEAKIGDGEYTILANYRTQDSDVLDTIEFDDPEAE